MEDNTKDYYGLNTNLKFKDLLILIFFIVGIYCVATEAYHVDIKPLPASGADVAPY